MATGSDPNLSSNVLVLWDQDRQKKVSEIEFLEPILDLHVCGRWVAVAHEKQVTLFDFESDDGLC